MKRRSVLMFGVVFLVGIILISFVSAEMLTSPANVSYDSSILENFLNQSEVRILVRLKDNSGLPVTSVKERDEWFKPQIGEVLNNLSNKEFQLDNRLTNGFSGYISKEGFYKLINDTRIREIILSPIESGARAMNNEKTLNLTWVLVSVGVLLILIILYLIKYRSNKQKRWWKKSIFYIY